MDLFGTDYYHIFPAYGPEYKDMSLYEQGWEHTDGMRFHFLHGPFGGGILSQPLEAGRRAIHFNAQPYPGRYFKEVYGLVLGNDAGEELAQNLCCCEPEYAPSFAVKMGLAERIPRPTVHATAEHANCLNDERYLVVVPKLKRRSLKLLDKLPEWFAHFGVIVDQTSSEVPTQLRAEMHDWFDQPDRLMYAYRVSGGESNAAWQLAVLYYIAEYWDINARGLDDIHFVANIDGQPNFRKFWTSNR